MSEILAPVGSKEALYAAIYSKADAVYMGLSRFNARIKADNFTRDNIAEYVRLCHLFNVKVYITFNTLIYDNELEEFEKEVQACVDANVDAFIVTDFGTLDIFRKYNVPLHASTQMGIHNLEGAKVAEKMGFTRVVLSREAQDKDIIDIKKNTNLEIEYFVHGALCVAFSGSCYLSSLRDNTSGNRGLCKQACRYSYKSSLSNEKKYYLSTSDQCMIDKISYLESIGVDSFKIEGRLKQAYYVGEVVKQYKNALLGQKEDNYKSKLYRVYNRGNFTKGYTWDKTKDLMSINIPSNMGDYVGRIVKTQGSTLYIQSDKDIKLHDAFKIIYKNKEIGGFLIDNIKKEKGLYIIKTLKSYPINSTCHITLDNSIQKEYENVSLKMNIKIECKCIENQNLYIAFKKDNIIAEYFGDKVLSAKNKAISSKDIMDKLGKLGDSYFTCIDDFKIEISSNPFIPISLLNNIKRELISKLEELIIEEYNKNKQTANTCKLNYNFNNSITKSYILAEISNLDNVTELLKSNSKIVLNISDFQDEKYLNIIKNQLIHNNLDNICLKLPKIARHTDIPRICYVIEKFKDHLDSLLIENVYGLEISNKYNLHPIGSYQMNIFNSNAAKNYNLQDFVASIELDKDSLNTIGHCYIYSYGRIECMTLTHCPVQNSTSCTCNDCKYQGEFSYFNGNEEYTIERKRVSSCYFSMYYNKIIDLRNNISKIKTNKYYLNFNNVDKKVIDEILKDFIDKKDKNISTFTGHFNNSVL